MNYSTHLNSFAKKVRIGEKVILYELVPPSKNRTRLDIEKSLSLIVPLLLRLSIDGINLPEVLEESRNGARNSKNIEKFDPVTLSNFLYKAGFTDIIINRPIVYIPWEKQKAWLESAYKKSLRNFIFVGGESSKIQYPGASVTQAARAVTQKLHNNFADILVGGITIPTRKNEAERVLKKTQAGIEFFTTQIMYESESIKQLLEEYWNLCRENDIKPKMIFLSCAPVTSKKDIELLSWLGVKIPHETLEVLSTGWLGMGLRSLAIYQTILDDVFQFMEKSGIGVPLGLNIGYINTHNFEFSLTFLERLAEVYLKHQRPKKFLKQFPITDVKHL